MSVAPATRFGLVDVNNFYVSCERIFTPALERQAVIVLSNNNGCAVSRSNEAKARGIKMGEPWHLIKDTPKGAGVVALSSNYTLYADMSNRVMRILEGLAPRVEVYSIDEAFLQGDGIQDLQELGRALPVPPLVAPAIDAPAPSTALVPATLGPDIQRALHAIRVRLKSPAMLAQKLETLQQLAAVMPAPIAAVLNDIHADYQALQGP